MLKNIDTPITIQIAFDKIKDQIDPLYYKYIYTKDGIEIRSKTNNTISVCVNFTEDGILCGHYFDNFRHGLSKIKNYKDIPKILKEYAY